MMTTCSLRPCTDYRLAECDDGVDYCVCGWLKECHMGHVEQAIAYDTMKARQEDDPTTHRIHQCGELRYRFIQAVLGPLMTEGLILFAVHPYLQTNILID